MEKDFPWDQEAVHAYSENLFGSSRRLEIALAILFVSEKEPHNLYKQALADRLGIGDGLVEKHLKVFRKAGLLENHPKPPRPPGKRERGAPRVVLQRTPDEFWHCLQQLGERFRRNPSSSSTQKKAKASPKSGVRESSA
jgi:predicted transcriptional regulator